MHPITHLYHLGDFERRKRLWQMKLWKSVVGADRRVLAEISGLTELTL
jgi:hypothetical protein